MHQSLGGVLELNYTCWGWLAGHVTWESSWSCFYQHSLQSRPESHVPKHIVWGYNYSSKKKNKTNWKCDKEWLGSLFQEENEQNEQMPIAVTFVKKDGHTC